MSEFFQASTVDANFSFWAKQASWRKREAAALFLGLNPERVLSADCTLLVDGQRYRSQLKGLLEMISRSILAGELSTANPPAVWTAWAGSRGVSVNPSLIQEVLVWNKVVDPRDEEIIRLRSEIGRLEKALAEAGKGVSPRERESLLKIALGLAIGGYKYDPTHTRKMVMGEIMTDFANHGISIGEDTVRKYLTEAAQLVDRP